ncbi:hypothetical protein L3X38_002972 [Prunus dulcis]|uniref:Uncharacterized protein n=1 Tax=Prunus dulcis TaxID=3755 RepID=A0AAD4WVT2_PRUDU|nr:hypothetical protein L3X38_002972 [Prunus dulcis]
MYSPLLLFKGGGGVKKICLLTYTHYLTYSHEDIAYFLAPTTPSLQEERGSEKKLCLHELAKVDMEDLSLFSSTVSVVVAVVVAIVAAVDVAFVCFTFHCYGYC